MKLSFKFIIFSAYLVIFTVLILKIIGIISTSWFWLTLPFWGSAMLVTAYILAMIIIVYIHSLKKNKK